MAQLQGWYETRRPVQIGFLLTVLISILILFAAASITLRGTMRRNGLALTGLVFVLGFVGMRAAGFHHMDRLINMEFHAVRVNWILGQAIASRYRPGSGLRRITTTRQWCSWLMQGRHPGSSLRPVVPLVLRVSSCAMPMTTAPLYVLWRISIRWASIRANRLL